MPHRSNYRQPSDAHRRVRLALLCRDRAALEDGVESVFKELGITTVRIHGAWLIACNCGTAHRLTLSDWTKWHLNWTSGSFEGVVMAITSHRALTGGGW